MSGLVPAIAGSHFDPITSLKDAGAASSRPGRRRLFPRGVLVSVQLALAFKTAPLRLRLRVPPL